MRPLKIYNIYLWILTTLCSSTIALGQPVAGFTATPTSGCAPLRVQFSDNSTGSPTNWNWDFGNGTVSTQQNPVTTFINPGIYTVKLTAGNTAGSNSTVKTQYITVYDKPVVKFTVNDSADCVPFNSNFTDLSTTSPGSIAAWQWEFDDGSFSNLQHPQHLYNQPGNYNITLKVTSSGGCTNSLSKLAYIKAADSIRTLFSFSQPTKCKPPETIRFTNNTLGPGTLTYLWKFGDGTSSTLASTSHAYASSGLFSVTLIATSSLGCKDTLVYKDTVAIRNVQTRISSTDTVCTNSQAVFSNATAPAPLSSKWVFNDGTTSFGLITAKTWTMPGVYTIKLLSNFSTCSDSVTKRITVLNGPVVGFSATDSAACKPPFIVNFNSIAPGAVNWNWDFGDGGSSSQQNPSHTFTDTGAFDIRLTGVNAGGCSSNITQYRFIKVSKPTIIFDTVNRGGCIPYSFAPNPLINSTDGIASYLWDFGNGQSSVARYPTEVYTDSGTYTVKLIVTTNDGCTDSAVLAQGIRTGNPPAVNFNIGATVICPGSKVQFTDQSMPADSWQWFFNDGSGSTAQNPTHAFSDSGMYSIRLVASNNGCKDSITRSKLIKVLPGLARFRPVYNCSNKKEVYFKDSSVLAQSWLWDFGDGTNSTQQNPTHQFANYQTYIVSLTTTNDSCTNTETMAVNLLNEVPDFSVSKLQLCKADSVFFQFRNFNKSNIIQYVWDFGDGSVDSVSTDSVWHTYRNPGHYSIRLSATDSNNCTNITTKANLIHVYSPVVGFAVNGIGGCRNLPVNFTDTSNARSGDNNIATWIWDFGDGFAQTYNAPLPNPVSHVYSSTGSFYPSLKIIDSAGCADSIAHALPISIYQPAAAFYVSNFNTCINDTLQLHNVSTGKNLHYWWDLGDGNLSTDSIPIKQYAANGNFTIKLVVTDTYGCKDSVTKNNYIKVKDVIASFTVSDSVGECTPFKVSFTNTSLNTLSQVWDFGDGGFSTTANPVYYYSTPGLYYGKLKAKRSGGCINTDSIRIKITAPTAVLSYAPLSGCTPLNVSFHVAATHTVSFIWDFNDGTSVSSTDSNIVHSYVSPSSFLPAVFLKDTGGCVVPVIGRDIIRLYNTKINFSVDDSVFCNSGTVRFNDASFSVSPITGYRWNFGDGTFSSLQNPVHLYTNPGVYPVKLAVTTSNCSDSIVKNNYIQVRSLPQVNITGNNLSYCGGATVKLQGSWLNPDSSTISWNWNFGNGNSSTLQQPPAQQFNDTGTYVIQLIASNTAVCVDTAGTSITINPAPNTFAGQDTAICNGTSAPLFATGADTYTWQPVSFLSCINCANPVTNAPVNTLYYVKGTNRFGCSTTDSVFVNVKQPFRLTGVSTAVSVCAGQPVQLNAAGAENYAWSPAVGLSSSTIQNPIATPAVDITYKVVGYDSSNCFKDSANVSITVNALPVVNAGPDVVVNSGRAVPLTPQYSTDVNTWLWQPSGSLSCSNCANPVATPATTTTYKIIVTNGNGCTDEDEITINVNCNRNSIYIPTAFSPGKGVNNVFYPLNTTGSGSIHISSFVVYNRYGQVVFENNHFNSNDALQGWDGRHKGRECPIGSYIYNISFICANRQTISFGGNFILVR